MDIEEKIDILNSKKANKLKLLKFIRKQVKKFPGDPNWKHALKRQNEGLKRINKELRKLRGA